jgi:ABC-2 type transport system permease protein
MVSAKRIIADFKVFSRGYLRNKFGLFFGLVFPVILILIFGAIFSSGSSGSINVYVQNQDTGPFLAPQMDISSQFLNALNGTLPNGTRISETWPIQVQIVSPSENFTQYLASHSSSDGIIIPANFSANYLAGTPEKIIVYGNPTSSTNGIVTGTANAVINNFNINYFQQKYNTNTPAIISIASASVNTQLPNYIDQLIPGLVGFSILVSPMFSLVNISSEYKKNKLFKQLSLTPLTKIEWLTSKVMWYIVLTITSFLLMVGVGTIAFQAHVTLTVWLIPFLILGPMLFASLGMLVGTVTKNPETAGVIGNIVTFPMMFLAGTFFPISIMPEYLRSIAHVLPLFYIVEGLNNVMVYGNITGALIDLVVVAIITVIIFLLAVKLFKWRED